MLAYALVTPGTALASGLFGHSLGLRRADLAGLARFAADVLARVLHALRLVRVGDAKRADLRGDLADDLLVHARDLQLLRGLDRERDAAGRGDPRPMRETERAPTLLPRAD